MPDSTVEDAWVGDIHHLCSRPDASTADAASLCPATPPTGCLGAITFSDNNLEQAIRQAISLPSGTISHTDVAQLSTLHAVSKSVVHLDGLQCLSCLQNLYLGGNAITDPAPLATMNSLGFIDLSENLIDDLSVLVQAPDFGTDAYINLWRNSFDCSAQSVHLAALEARNATVARYCWTDAEPDILSLHVFGTGNVFDTGATFTVGHILQDMASVLDQNPSQLDVVVSDWGGHADPAYYPVFTSGNLRVLRNEIRWTLAHFPEPGFVGWPEVPVGSKTFLDQYGNYFTTAEPELFEPLPYDHFYRSAFYAGSGTNTHQFSPQIQLVVRDQKFLISACGD